MAALQRPDSGDKEAVREYTNVLYKQEKWEQLFEYLQEALGSGNDPDLTWRLIRCGYRLGQKTFDAGDSGEAERIANICMERGQRALKENDRNANLHKWVGILLQLLGDIGGMKIKILNAYKIREHFTKALEIHPGDVNIRHLLGRWCYKVASISWWQRKMAGAILATPPTSSYDEAFSYFNSAEKDSPGFFKANWLWLGKTLLQLNRKAEAKKWIQKLVDTETDGIEDNQAKKEAKTILQGL